MAKNIRKKENNDDKNNDANDEDDDDDGATDIDGVYQEVPHTQRMQGDKQTNDDQGNKREWGHGE